MGITTLQNMKENSFIDNSNAEIVDFENYIYSRFTVGTYMYSRSRNYWLLCIIINY